MSNGAHPDGSAKQRTRERLGWLDTILADHTVPRSRFPLAYLISGLIGPDGYAWPGEEYLAERLGCDVRTVRQCVNAYRSAGYLGVQKGGWGTSNRYRLTYPNASADRIETSGQTRPLDGSLTGQNSPVNELTSAEIDRCQSADSADSIRSICGANQEDSRHLTGSFLLPDRTKTPSYLSEDLFEDLSKGTFVRSRLNGASDAHLIDELSDRLFQQTGRIGRRRTRRSKIAAALRAAESRGHDLNRVVGAVTAYQQSWEAQQEGGQYEKAVHELIALDRWEPWSPEPYPPEMLD